MRRRAFCWEHGFGDRGISKSTMTFPSFPHRSKDIPPCIVERPDQDEAKEDIEREKREEVPLRYNIYIYCLFPQDCSASRDERKRERELMNVVAKIPSSHYPIDFIRSSRSVFRRHLVFLFASHFHSTFSRSCALGMFKTTALNDIFDHDDNDNDNEYTTMTNRFE